MSLEEKSNLIHFFITLPQTADIACDKLMRLSSNRCFYGEPQVNLTPGRVAQGFGTIIAMIGTPASAPKPRGKSPGWQKGKVRQRKTRSRFSHKKRDRLLQKAYRIWV